MNNGDLNGGELNDGELNDGELNEGELGDQLRDLAPGPGPGFWADVDARLAGAAPPATAPDVETRTGSGPSGWDTGATVVRLTDMNSRRSDPTTAARSRSRSRTPLLAVAAALAVLLSGAGLVAWRDRAIETDASADGSSPAATSAAHGEGGEGAGEGAVGTMTEPTLGPIGNRPPPGTTCFRNGLEPEGEPVLRLDVFPDGQVLALEMNSGPEGPLWVAAGRFVTRADLLMTVSDSETSRVRIWSWAGGRLGTAEDVVYEEAACGDLDEVSVSSATAARPDGFTVEPGRRCFADLDDTPMPDHIHIEVTDAETVTVETSTTIEDGAPGATATTATDAAFFATPTELVLLVAGGPGAEQAATVWTVTDDELAFTDIGWTVTAVDCATVDDLFDDGTTAGTAPN